MAASAVDGMYLYYSIPLGLANILTSAINSNQGNPNTPQVATTTAVREWFSQPRPGSDATTEVLQVNFKLPLSVSEVGWDALRITARTEVWYQDRQNNWRQVLDESRIPVALNMSYSASAAWYKAHFYCYSIVAKALQFRFQRRTDPVMGNNPYCVGMKNALIRRNIYTRSDGTAGIEPQQDPLGNTFTSWIKDWDAAKAFDNDPNTFWRSAPMPDPKAVVNLYLDCRTPDGGSQPIDTLYIDPVYTGQALNIYYSNDDTEGIRKLSPITAVSTVDENTNWMLGVGRWDTSDDSGTSDYEFNIAWGPLVRQDAWLGIEWAPDFDGGASSEVQVVSIQGGMVDGDHFVLSLDGQPTANLPWDVTSTDMQSALEGLSTVGVGNVIVSGQSPTWSIRFQNSLGRQDVTQIDALGSFSQIGASIAVATQIPGGISNTPPANPVLFQITPAGGTAGANQYWPKFFYDVGAGQLTLEFTNGITSVEYNCPITQVIQSDVALRIVVGWSYTPAKHVYISVRLSTGQEVGHLDLDESSLPDLVTLDGSVGFTDFRGLFTAHVVKLESYIGGVDAFQANPKVYVSPDPVMPDPSGNIPATSLDNAIYAAAWVYQEHGTGGDHETRYQDKLWTPIWQNYVTQKGKFHFPQQISLKYIKLEFTNLSEEPYPVYDSGIQVSYNAFPVSVSTSLSINSSKSSAGLLTVSSDIALSALSGVNFLNPSTINAVVNSVYGQVTSPVDVTVGNAQSITLPNTTSLNVSDQTRREVNSPYVYRRTPVNAYTLAGQHLSTAGSGDQNQGTQPAINQLGTAVNDAFTPLVNYAAASTGLPVQGADWWVFPGATLRLPSVVMTGMTGVSQTVFSRSSITARARFNTTSVHRYDIKTATRDASLAYFAGVREVQPYITTYIDELDPPIFKFDNYANWVSTNVKSLDSGPISTAGAIYDLNNGNFDTDINNWVQAQGDWYWDSGFGHWFPGKAGAVFDGTTHILQSNLMDTSAGTHLSATVWVSWENVVSIANSTPIQLTVLNYNNGTFVSQGSTVGITYTDWTTHADGDWTQLHVTYTVPNGVNGVRVGLYARTATAGTVFFDTADIGTTDLVDATVYKDFTTTSPFAKVKCEFTDSGLIRSDDMWAREDPNDLNISNTALAYYTSTIPDQIPAGMWSDTFAGWGDPDISWGAPKSLVAINVDPDRIYDGKRVLHFSRGAGALEAGVKVRQWTNFVAGGLFRIGAVFLKPTANNNTVTLRLRRVSDGVYIGPNNIDGDVEVFSPVVGYWYEKVTDFIEVPDGDDQEYTVELVLTGDDPDEFYLNDLYVELANIRYYVRLGGEDQFLHDVTQLRYADSSIVSTTVPTNEFSVQLSIHSPKAWAYGAVLTPTYLK
jgi:hypothetical protein